MKVECGDCMHYRKRIKELEEAIREYLKARQSDDALIEFNAHVSLQKALEG